MYPVPPRLEQQLADLFRYSQPQTAEQQARIDQLCASTRELAVSLYRNCPPSHELEVAIGLLRTAAQQAVFAILVHERLQGSDTDLKEVAA